MSPTIKDLYPDKWIRASDLPREGQILTITRATIETVYNTIDREQQPRLILDFHEVDTRAILNKTQAFDIADITKEEDYSKWVGYQIQLTPGQARNKKPTIIFKPAPTAPKQTQQPNDPQLDAQLRAQAKDAVAQLKNKRQGATNVSAP